MGDLASPRKSDALNRLRQRFQGYRDRDNDSARRYQSASPYLYEAQRQETLLLSQRCQESKAKKSSKSSTRPNKEPNSNHQQNQPKFNKRKLDNTTATEGNNADQFKFEDPLSPPSKAQCTSHPNAQASYSDLQHNNNSGTQSAAQHCVSVNIVQQINTAPTQNNVNSEIKINVQSTVHTSQCSGSSSSSTQIKTSTNICKEENSTSNPNQSYPELNLEGDELQELLDALENPVSTQDLHSSTIKSDNTRSETVLNNNPIVSSASQSPPACHNTASVSAQSSVVFSNKSQPQPPSYYSSNKLADNSPLGNKDVATRQRSDGMYAGTEAYEPSRTNYGNMAAQAAPNCMPGAFPPSPAGPSTPTGAAVPPLGPLGESGPAAETLKQMAAQHQNNEYKTPYGPYAPDGFGRRHGYPGYNMPGYMGATANGAFPYNHSMAGGERMPYNPTQMGAPQAPQHMGGPRAAMSAQGPSPRTPLQGHHSPLSMPGHSPTNVAMKATYPGGAGKPMPGPPPHYSGGPTGSGASSTSPSSLQQLQDQVKTQFGPGAHAPRNQMDAQIQFSQSQQMRMSYPGMHMSQQMHFQATGNQNISVGQQQSFNMAYNANSNGVRPPAPQNEYEQMRMYKEKMREQEAHRRQQHMAGGQGGGNTHPPPEYPAPATSNPLQTMQTMVDQTSHSNSAPANSTPRTDMFPAAAAAAAASASAATDVKQESMPRHSMATSIPQPRTPQTPVTSVAVAPFSTASQSVTTTNTTTQASSTPQTSNNTDVKPTPADSSTYTSAIMRGQRPPNVNVGPEGLNISQPRMSGWHRPPMGGHQSQAAMIGGPGMAAGGGGVQTGAHPMGMQYGGGVGYGGHQGGMSMQQMRMHMSQQQAMHMRTMGGGPMHSGMAAAQGMGMSAMGAHPGMGGPGYPGMRHPGMAHHPGMSHGGGMVMSQHQQQHLHMHNGAGHGMHAGMVQASAMNARGNVPPHPSQHPYTQSHPPSSQAAPNYALDFLDNPQASNPDFFDPVVPSSNPSEFNFIDDILGSK